MNHRMEPDKMTPAERLDEIAGILAAGLLRLHARHVASPKEREFFRDNPLGCPGETRPPAVDL